MLRRTSPEFLSGSEEPGFSKFHFRKVFNERVISGVKCVQKGNTGDRVIFTS